MIILLDRTMTAPETTIHGWVRCARCGEWCWLGSATRKVVDSGQADPWCRMCVTRYIPADVAPIGQVFDQPYPPKH